ncbi:hypothetical protein BJ742DRAFT_904864 [Cladochytrium replicatum]|nr:hypothetical protein BJ742DRAFT_904864 [Cladochytrium replicatum]
MTSVGNFDRNKQGKLNHRTIQPTNHLLASVMDNRRTYPEASTRVKIHDDVNDIDPEAPPDSPFKSVAEAGASTGFKKRTFSVPLIVPLGLVFAIPLLGICVPVWLLFTLTGNDSISSIGEQNLMLIMEQVSTQTAKVLAVAVAAHSMVFNNADIMRALSTKQNPVIMSNQTDALEELLHALNTQQIHNGVVCQATENYTGRSCSKHYFSNSKLNWDTGVIDPNRKYYSNTPPPFLGIYKVMPDTPFALIMDDTTGWKLRMTPWNGQGPLGNFSIDGVATAVAMNVPPWTAYSVLDAIDGHIIWAFGYTDYHFRTEQDRALGVIPSYYCNIIIEVQTSFSRFIEALSGTFTNGTRIFLFEQMSGLMVTADNASAIAGPKDRFQANGTADITIATLVTALQQRFPSTNSAQFISRAAFDGPTMRVYASVVNQGSVLFLVRVHLMTDFGTNWVAVIAIPYDGFFGATAAARVRALIIGSVLGAVGLSVTILLSYFTVRPLAILSKAIRELTKFDFSMLEKKSMDRRSMIKEINELQDTFMVMVRAFAATLKVNRALTTGKYQSTVDSKSHI